MARILSPLPSTRLIILIWGCSLIPCFLSAQIPDSNAPSVPAGLAGSAVSVTSVNLSWTASTDNVGVAGYRVYRNGAQVGMSATNQYHDSGLMAGTAYSYSIVAYDSAGNSSAPCPVVSAATPAATSSIVLQGVAVDYRRIDLLWTARSASVTSSEEVDGRFEVFRDGVLWKETEQEYLNSKYYISHSTCDYPVEAESTHRYYVRGYDIHGGFIGQSDEVIVTTPAQYGFDYLPAFPGAEGFGAGAAGGRGGRVVYVTNGNVSGSGSFRDAVMQQGARYILFRYSGVIETDGWYNMNGDFTFAGHTSPGGVIARGFISNSQASDTYQGLSNVIIRHLRSRPDGRMSDPSLWPDGYTPTAEELTWGLPGGSDDAMRLSNTYNVIVDHCSFGRASDECFQFSASNFVTVQNTILSETLGSHYGLGGMLLSYNTQENPLNNISIHHNMWNRIHGRLPEMGCNDGRGNDVVFNFELSNNLIWDPGTTIGVHYSGSPYNPQDKLYYHLNWIGNYMRTRDDFRQGMIEKTILFDGFSLYVSDNRMSLYPDYSDYQIVYGNTDFFRHHPNTEVGDAIRLQQRHPYAPVSYTSSDGLINYMIDNVGAFPRDAMDRRLIGSLERNEIDPTHRGVRPANDGHLFDWITPPIPPLDSDDDGMPDWWELHNGLNPLVQDHNGKGLSVKYTGIVGYDNLECYLNRLSDHYVEGAPMTEGVAHAYPLAVSSFTVSHPAIPEGQSVELEFVVTPSNPNGVSLVELSLANVSAPFGFPSPTPVNISANRVGNAWRGTFTVPSTREPGRYQVLAHVRNVSGQDGYAMVSVVVGSSTVNHAPVLAPVGNRSVEAGQEIQFTVEASDADGNEIQYSATGGAM